ncbi:MAG: CPBP family intramembrane glutamic endopeptidase [Gemmatimonadales bacterium]|nr:CPBP family intramembrane glutamic endopeptidase [Gemmatimonadales bacterium]
MSRLEAYGRASRAPRYSLLFALPLLLAYEALAAALGGPGGEGIRNGADVLLKSLFLGLGGERGLRVFALLLLGGGGVLVVRDLRASGWRLEARVFLLMLAESLVHALLLGVVAGWLTARLLGGLPLATMLAGGGGVATLDLPTQLMVSLGAGLYEELLFRVLLVGALAWAARALFRWPPAVAGVVATVLGAVIFSAFHYVGPLGDRLEVGSFTFRAIAGVLFSALYLVRGFGITAWAHALYDVLIALR